MGKERSAAEFESRGKETGPFRVMKDGEWFDLYFEGGQPVYKKIEDQPKMEWLKE